VLAVTIIILSLPGLSVNPIARGLQPLTDKQVFRQALAAQANIPDPQWVVFGDAYVSQAFVANGFTTLGGNKFIPDPDQMLVLDPGGNSSNVWNRYARIKFVVAESHLATFELVHTDSYKIFINPCSDQLKRIGVTNAGSTSPLDLAHFPCLTAYSANLPVNGVYLYVINHI
jgi:hypothetical protein